MKRVMVVSLALVMALSAVAFADGIGAFSAFKSSGFYATTNGPPGGELFSSELVFSLGTLSFDNSYGLQTDTITWVENAIIGSLATSSLETETNVMISQQPYILNVGTFARAAVPNGELSTWFSSAVDVADSNIFVCLSGRETWTIESWTALDTLNSEWLVSATTSLESKLWNVFGFYPIRMVDSLGGTAFTAELLIEYSFTDEVVASIDALGNNLVQAFADSSTFVNLSHLTQTVVVGKGSLTTELVGGLDLSLIVYTFDPNSGIQKFRATSTSPSLVTVATAWL
jgi:hypothetical protein